MFAERKTIAPQEVPMKRGGRVIRTSEHEHGGIELDVSLEKKEIRLRGQPVRITLSEWIVIERLALANGSPVSREDIIRALRFEGWDGRSRSVDLLVSRLRTKLGDTADRQRLIRTVRHVGYLLRLPGGS
jgi:DNA-binding response OmpR family regulator